MSENLDKKKIEELASSYDSEVNKVLSDAEKELEGAIKDFESAVGKDIAVPSDGGVTPAVDNVNSRGYNPEFQRGVDNSSAGSNGGSSLGKKEGLEKPSSSDTGKAGDNSSKDQNNNDEAANNQQENASSQDNNQHGKTQQDNTQGTENTGKPGEKNEGANIENFPDRENPVDGKPTGEQNASKKDSGGLEKKDGLESQKGDDERQKNNTGKKETNPEASDSANKPNENSASTGNGYGALKNKKASNADADGTRNARRNLEHQKRMQRGKQAENGENKSSNNNQKSDNENSLNPFSNLGNKFKNGIKNFFNGNGESTTSKGIKPGQKVKGRFMDAFKNGIKNFIMTNPYAAIIIGVVVIILLILIITSFDEMSGGGGGSGTHCTYDLQGVTNTGTVKLEGLQVELINCDGTASDYTVLETVDFEKYVLGVALAEAGPDAPEEALKAQIIAARSYSLTRNSAMCPGNPDGCFYGYNSSTGKVRLRACEADQVYWDYEKDIYREDRGNISRYSPEVNSGTLWKSALTPERQEAILAIAEDVEGKVLVDANNDVYYTNYVASITQQFVDKANEGKDYEQILAEVYEDSDGFSSGTCTSYGNIDYGDYVLSSEGHQILHQPLDSFLESKGSSTEEFAALIASNVDDAGYGTRAGVVAAAVTLIGELGNNYGVKIPYYWGGGHYDGVVDGVLDYWGSTECHTYANGQNYNYCGFDCSGFVPWAIKNGGFNIGGMLAGDFQYLSGVRRVSLSSSEPVLEPGDLLESDSHIVLVIGIEESTKKYICAEASGNADGVLFTKRSYYTTGYWGVKMDGYYETKARSK